MQDPADLSVPLPPPPPRPILPRVRRRAWAEPTVRFWWLMAAALLVLAPIVGAPPVKRWQTLFRLADQPPVQARLLRTHREAIEGRPVLPGDTVQIEINTGDKPRQLWGTLDGWAQGPLPRVGSTVEIRVDPQNPDVWAVVHKVPPLLTALATGLVVAAIALIPLLLAIVLRRRILKTWRDGGAREAAILSSQTTALAPGAWAAQCAWIEDEGAPLAPHDRTIFRVFIPKRLRPTQEEGQTAMVLALPKGGKRVAVEWFNG